MNADLTYQQNVVYNRLDETLKFSRESFRGIRSRATLVCAASTTIVGIITAAKFLPKSAAESNPETVLLGLVCICSIFIYRGAGKLWGSAAAEDAGTTDTNRLFDEYLSKDKGTAYNNFLIDLAATVKSEVKANRDIGDQLDRIILAFQWQLGLLAGAILWPALAALGRWLQAIC
jgi:hypothetical protein